jgi:carboxyl-terminal processing protease
MSNQLRNGLTVFMLVLLAVSAFLAGYLTRELTGVRSDAYAQEDMSLFWEAWGHVQDTFIGEIPTDNAITYGAIRGSLGTLNDPYTVFIEPAVRDVERESLQGRFGGIGAYIRLDEATGVVTLEPIPGNPAEAAGIQAGDILLAVDGAPLAADLTVPQIAELIKGETGTSVRLRLQRPGEAEPYEVDVVRADILLPSVTYQLLEADPTIGYVNLSRFSGESGQEVGAALGALLDQGAERFILDLRSNGGGLRDAAVAVADHFLVGGPVLYLDSRDGGERAYEASTTTLVPDAPLVVLVDGGTASASEIVAGALQDRQRATLIGSQTFGKGSVQLVYDLSDGSSVHVTSARWLTPNRQQIDQLGLAPDITVEVTQEAIDSGRDPALERAITFLQTGQ